MTCLNTVKSIGIFLTNVGLFIYYTNAYLKLPLYTFKFSLLLMGLFASTYLNTAIVFLQVSKPSLISHKY